MAAHIEGIFDKSLKESIANTKLLVVGAGGIGCELLKTLVLTGFENIHVIDLDTIDVSNLNRQFLFHKQHINRSKAEVAKESVLKFNPKANIKAEHASITNTEYDVQFYRQFTIVLNALDNVAARSHVNRMCMAAEVPLIESGSAGYLGQATVYKRKATECFECLPRKPQKTYAGCTIRNTPSEPVHCVVWAKHLFNQLFGESDEEDEVSPDMKDPEMLPGEAPREARPSTTEMAKTANYDPAKLFIKLFVEDIFYLKSMQALWKKRKAPIPVHFDNLPDAVPGCSRLRETEIADLRPWSLRHCGDVFKKCVIDLRKRIQDGGPGTVLTWDKDDPVCMDFVVACANVRSYCFHIPQKSKFDVKAIAGNIIPAIATTNAVVGGLIVLQILKLIKGDISKCRTTWINESYKTTNKLISCAQLEKPNPKCLVCSTEEPEVKIQLNVNTLTIKTLAEKILKEELHMNNPDVVINDLSGKILISSDPEDMSDEMYDKSLSCFGIREDSRLLCEDFYQIFKINLVISHNNELPGQEFQIETDIKDVKAKEESSSNSNPEPANSDGDDAGITDVVMDCVDPDLEIVPVDETVIIDGDSDDNSMEPPAKKSKKAGQ